jgi:Flp pilus assembly protein TadG
VPRSETPRTSRRGSNERGSAAVEFALLLPILLMVLVAVVQVGVIARDRLLLSQAARAGAREAAITDSADAIRDAAVRAAPGLDADRLGLEVAREGGRGSPVNVSASYEVPVASVLAGWLLPATVSLDVEAAARQEFG